MFWLVLGRARRRLRHRVTAFLIWFLKNIQKSSPSGLQIYDQQAKRVHNIKLYPFAITASFVRTLLQFTQLPRRSGSNPGLRGGWYQLVCFAFVACWLFGTGLISLSENPVPVEEQLVWTTIAASATATNQARSMPFTKTQEEW